MARKTYFTAGPAEMYPTFEKHLQTAMDEQIGSISHRSQQFRKIYQHTVENLRALMNIPETSGIFFTGSASEIWERILLNLVEHESFHLVNGAFSEKFFKYAIEVHKYAHVLEKPLGQGFDYNEIDVPPYAELICVTQNETSSGVSMREVDIHKLKRGNTKKMVAVDIVSSAPYPDLDLNLIDTAFFSVQKAFGLPAGLGVWIANEKCLEKAEHLHKFNETHPHTSIGGHHTLPVLWKNFKNYETPATPNVIGIYLLGKVAEDMNKTGISTLRKQTEEKAKAIYKFLEKNEDYEPFVENAAHRSQTVVVANTKKPSAEIISTLKESNIILGAGYGANKDNQIRIANFPAISEEKMNDLLKKLSSI